MGARGDIENRIGQMIDKHRKHQRDIGKMRAPGVGIVQNHDIATLERERIHGRLDRHGHGAEMHRHVVAHGNDPALRIKDCAGVIAALDDIGRDRSAAQRGSHLFGNRMHGALKNRQSDRIGNSGRYRHQCTSMIRLSSAST
jgi:hypothetical protein